MREGWESSLRLGYKAPPKLRKTDELKRVMTTCPLLYPLIPLIPNGDFPLASRGGPYMSPEFSPQNSFHNCAVSLRLSRRCCLPSDRRFSPCRDRVSALPAAASVHAVSMAKDPDPSDENTSAIANRCHTNRARAKTSAVQESKSQDQLLTVAALWLRAEMLGYSHSCQIPRLLPDPAATAPARGPKSPSRCLGQAETVRPARPDGHPRPPDRSDPAQAPHSKA